ncbi:MAG: hypothetical protein O2931_06230 [Planctomycetota bacterium]|nr:hypothetical protein [Planctomycetota bacterium]MDA1178381.1 hypothetical protein [Planctomycetota bacterium]
MPNSHTDARRQFLERLARYLRCDPASLVNLIAASATLSVPQPLLPSNVRSQQELREILVRIRNAIGQESG